MMMEDEGKLEPVYNGSKFTVIHCIGAVESFYESAKSLVKQKARTMEMQIVIQIKRLADGKRMATDTFVSEGSLPSDKKFYALKRIPIRGYLWFSESRGGVCFISHYVYKDYPKLNKSNIRKIHSNWRRIEEDGHEK
ncbi:hypothetical protein [Photorhabdus luminescens]|uniref:hypothetical protein n=1 Tax=Photorhabdus luminescens TaxID=29488 RepID=UPI001131A302|nr:hypothetical protein [Photorhabdus luminescens]